ncbi:tyrosine-protein phosphatase, partial [Mycolicibacterium sp. CBMA 295]
MTRNNTDLGELSGAWNFRDVAGETAIRPGLLYRSSQLSQLSEDGRAVFRRLGITDVADLRSHQEVQRQGSGQV